jgi:stearoyl-CoA desaturase (delta-9 desaturase)
MSRIRLRASNGWPNRYDLSTDMGQTLDSSVAIGTVRPTSSAISKVVTLVAVVVPPLGLASAMGLLWGVAFHPVDLILLVALYVICAFGTTIGFHR